MTAEESSRWRLTLKHLEVAVHRLISNFSVHAGVGKKVAAAHVERIAQQIREQEEKRG